MEKRALLVVSFGTGVPAAREAIAAVEEALRETASGYAFYRAFTSPTIRGILRGRGERVFSLEEALETLADLGYAHVLLQPTHLLFGYEYDKLKESALSYAPRFSSLSLGKPLLADTESLKELARCLAEEYPFVEGEALAFIGHGTAHFANLVYPAMQTAFWLMGRRDILVGTVEGWPGQREALQELKAGGFQKARLVPLLLVAGEHALNDMAGEKPDSWKSALEKAGYRVRCELTGLGMRKGVQELYCAHLREMLSHGV